MKNIWWKDSLCSACKIGQSSEIDLHMLEERLENIVQPTWDDLVKKKMPSAFHQSQIHLVLTAIENTCTMLSVLFTLTSLLTLGQQELQKIIYKIIIMVNWMHNNNNSKISNLTLLPLWALWMQLAIVGQIVGMHMSIGKCTNVWMNSSIATCPNKTYLMVLVSQNHSSIWTRKYHNVHFISEQTVYTWNSTSSNRLTKWLHTTMQQKTRRKWR